MENRLISILVIIVQCLSIGLAEINDQTIFMNDYLEEVHTNGSWKKTFEEQDCTRYNCFRTLHCDITTYNLPYFVYPPYKFVDNNNYAEVFATRSMLSHEFRQLLNALVEDPRYTDKPERACLFVTNIDISYAVHGKNLTLSFVSNLFDNLPYWRYVDGHPGTNHIVISLDPYLTQHELIKTAPQVFARTSIVTSSLNTNYIPGAHRSGLDYHIPAVGWWRTLGDVSAVGQSVHDTTIRRRWKFLLMLESIDNQPLDYQISGINSDNSADRLTIASINNLSSSLGDGLIVRANNDCGSAGVLMEPPKVDKDLLYQLAELDLLCQDVDNSMIKAKRIIKTNFLDSRGLKEEEQLQRQQQQQLAGSCVCCAGNGISLKFPIILGHVDFCLLMPNTGFDVNDYQPLVTYPVSGVDHDGNRTHRNTLLPFYLGAALQFGCIPIVSGDIILPFEDLIDWSKLSLTLTNPVDLTNLKHLIDSDKIDAHELRNNGQKIWQNYFLDLKATAKGIMDHYDRLVFPRVVSAGH